MFKPLELLDRALQDRMLFAESVRLERDDRVEHRRKDGSQTVASLEALDHPVDIHLERLLAERVQSLFGKTFGEPVHLVDAEEEIAPSESVRILLKLEVTLVDALRVKLVRG